MVLLRQKCLGPGSCPLSNAFLPLVARSFRARLLIAVLLTPLLLFAIASVSAAQCASGNLFKEAVTTGNSVPGGWACAAGDLDKDGYADAAFLGATNSLVIKLGGPTLSLGEEIVIPLSDAGLGVALRDVNGDGFLDLLYVTDSALIVKYAIVTNGVWQRTFSAPTSVASIGGARRLAVADLDGDGNLDVVVGSAGNQIAVHAGRPGGTFGPAQLYAFSSTPFSVAVGDFNADGRLDIVAASLSADVWVLFGNGTPGQPRFTSPAFYRAFVEPLQLAVADFNGDGALDFACSDDPGKAAVFMGRVTGGVPNGAFDGPVGYSLGVTVPYGFAAADLDGDGIVDLASGNNGGTLSVIRGRGDGTFGAPEIYSTGSEGNDLAIADLNADTAPDLVVGGGGKGVILPGLCPSSPQPPFISRFVPTGGAAGDHIKIFGSFIAGPSEVRIGGAHCEILSGPAYPVVVVVPIDAVTGPVQLATVAGVSTSTSTFFVGPPPVISGFTPTSARPGQVVTVSGAHFASATFCSFGGQDPSPFAVISDSQLELTVDGNATDGPVHVRTTTGEAVSIGAFTVLPPDSAAKLVAVRDARNDQGGKVILRWARSEVDEPVARAIKSYRVWRRAPLEASGASRSVAVATPPPGPGWYWEALGEVPAAYLTGYSFTASTQQDSTATDPGWTAFFIQALTRDDARFYFSNVDSGYSVDNLAPPSPSPLVANYTANGTLLKWPQSVAGDFAHFQLYRGSSTVFVPNADNHIATLRDTTYRDNTPGAFTYKLRSVDVHGNLSRVVTVTPDRPVATLASLVVARALPDKVELVWLAEAGTGLSATLYRWSPETDWVRMGTLDADGQGFIRFVDVGVVAGATYRYRLGIEDAGTESFYGEAEVTVPAASVSFTLSGGNPVHGRELSFHVSIPDPGRGSLELMDISGRLLAQTELQGPTSSDITLRPAKRCPAGVYLVRLRTSGREVMRRVVVTP